MKKLEAKRESNEKSDTQVTSISLSSNVEISVIPQLNDPNASLGEINLNLPIKRKRVRKPKLSTVDAVPDGTSSSTKKSLWHATDSALQVLEQFRTNVSKVYPAGLSLSKNAVIPPEIEPLLLLMHNAMKDLNNNISQISTENGSCSIFVT